MIIPSGTAIQNARTSVLGDTFNRDGSHLNKIGKYTAACTWYEALTGASPVGNRFIPGYFNTCQITIAQNAAHLALQNPKQISPFV